MALSGMLFFLGIEHVKQQTCFSFIKNKFCKLMVPFILTNILYLAPIRYITHYYPNNFLIGVLDGQFLLHGNNYLWYLEALFVISVIAFFLEAILKLDRIIIFFIMFLLSLCRVNAPSLLYSALEDGFWFYFGFLFAAERISINAKIRQHPFIITVLSWVGLIITKFLTSYGIGDSTFIYYLTGFLGIIATYSASYLLVQNPSIRNNTLISYLACNGLYLYIFSDPLNGLINYIAATNIGLIVFSNNLYSLILHIVKFFVTATVPLFLAYLISKVKQAAKSTKLLL